MTGGMKVAVSIPDDVSAEADRVAKELGTSRSGFYRRALTSYLERMAPRDRTTEALDSVIDQVESVRSAFVRVAARNRLEQSDW